MLLNLDLDLNHDQIIQLQLCNIPGYVNIQGCLFPALELSPSLYPSPLIVLNGENESIGKLSSENSIKIYNEHHYLQTDISCKID